MERGDTEVSGLGKRNRVLHGFPVSDFSYQYDIGSLSQGVFQGVVPIARVHADLALIDDRFLVAMHKLDGILNRDDVPTGVTVAVIDHRG